MDSYQVVPKGVAGDVIVCLFNGFADCRSTQVI